LGPNAEVSVAVPMRGSPSPRPNRLEITSLNAVSAHNKRREKVVFATLQNNPGTCRTDNQDWRGGLPRYIASRFDVFIWNARDALDTWIKHDCRRCFKDGYLPSKVKTFNCEAWFRNRGHAMADVVVVIGTGVSKGMTFPQLHRIFEQPWVGNGTRFVHIPISRNKRILNNEVATFERVVEDGKWVKPLKLEDLGKFLTRCKAMPKTKTLAYVARYVGWKGQLSFLESVDPGLLEGYKIEFFASQVPTDSNYTQSLLRVAAQRGIQVKLQSEPLDREALLERLCRSSGLIHYAAGDANPRALYEAILARLPAFVTRESRIPDIVQKQPFVIGTNYSPGTNKPLLNHDFARFMQLIQNREKEDSRIEYHLDVFINTVLEAEHALHNMCKLMGLC